MMLSVDQTCQRLKLEQIEWATNNFDEALVIGRGGFGKVYKSLSNFGSSVNEVAIKRLLSTSNQGTHEFEAEVKLLSTLRHGNLVPLIGYCSEGKEMILAYEFMPNGTVEDHLHRCDTELSWLQRLKICIGAARGLDYLHTGTSSQRGVMHRDVKTSNILLDSNFAARISDFGLAKVGPTNQTQTHVSTLVKGTFGYIDPSYFYSGQLTIKSDVYAFGVVLFELLSGKQAVDQTLDEHQWSLAVWAQDRFKERRLNEIINYQLSGQVSRKGLKDFASVAVQCLHNQPKQRPTMAEVVVKLESILSREKEHTGVDDGRFINKVRYFYSDKTDLTPAHVVGNKPETSALYIQKFDNPSVKTYTLYELEAATDYWKHDEFSTNSHRTIYKGRLECANSSTSYDLGFDMYVIKTQIGTSQLAFKPEEFNHPNLVKLLGYCLDKRQLYRVYELLRDSSLDQLLFGGTASLSWVARLKIAIGAAQGLYVLHKKGHPAYIQFKTSCILVTEDYYARLKDFEVDNSFLALDSYLFETDAHYAAPEWFHYQADVILEENICPGDHEHGCLGVNSEIYSFGVVLLEILTGMKVYDRNRREGKQNLVKWATPMLANVANLRIILDPQLKGNNHPPKVAYKLAQLVLNCLQPAQDKRPSMKRILQVLNECYMDVNVISEIALEL